MHETSPQSGDKASMSVQRIFEMGVVITSELLEWNPTIIHGVDVPTQLQDFKAEAQAFRDNDYASGALPTSPLVPALNFAPKVSAKLWFEDNDDVYVFMDLADRDSRGALLTAQAINVMNNPDDRDEVTTSLLQVSRQSYKELVPGRNDYEPQLLQTIHDRLVAIKQQQTQRELISAEDELINRRERRIVHPTLLGKGFAPDVPDQPRLARVISLRRRDQ